LGVTNGELESVEEKAAKLYSPQGPEDVRASWP
jgi:hypothetical protein